MDADGSDATASPSERSDDVQSASSPPASGTPADGLSASQTASRSLSPAPPHAGVASDVTPSGADTDTEDGSAADEAAVADARAGARRRPSLLVPRGDGVAALLADVEAPPRLRAEFARKASSDEYLDNFDVPFYLRDAVELVLRVQPEDPVGFMYAYFKSVLNGTNILRREFSYVACTVSNRLALVAFLDEPMRGFGADAEMVPDDALQLLCLLCDDMPKSVFRNALAVMGMPSSAPVRLGELSNAVLLLIVFSEVFAEVAYFCSNPASGGRDGSPIRQSTTPQAILDAWPIGTPHWVDATMTRLLPRRTYAYLEARASSRLQPLWCPPLRFLKEALLVPPHTSGRRDGAAGDADAGSRVTYGAFCRALCGNSLLAAWVKSLAAARAAVVVPPTPSPGGSFRRASVEGGAGEPSARVTVTAPGKSGKGGSKTGKSRK